MNSCLYQALVMHHRLQPRQHRFHYNVFMFYIDLDELELLRKKISLFSYNRFNFFSFHDKEHLQLPIDQPDTVKTTKQHIIDYLAGNGIDFSGKIMLLTNLNVLGYNFNPVSFYFCFDEKEKPVCCIAEISNTFREMKPFLMKGENLENNHFRMEAAKYFYVSPFIDHDTILKYDLLIPGEKLALKIDDYQNGNKFFISTVTGAKKAITNNRLLWYSFRFPFMTIRIIGLIHWNALLLWLKKLPYHTKAANPELQKDVYKKYKTRN